MGPSAVWHLLRGAEGEVKDMNKIIKKKKKKTGWVGCSLSEMTDSGGVVAMFVFYDITSN